MEGYLISDHFVRALKHVLKNIYFVPLIYLCLRAWFKNINSMDGEYFFILLKTYRAEYVDDLDYFYIFILIFLIISMYILKIINRIKNFKWIVATYTKIDIILFRKKINFIFIIYTQNNLRIRHYHLCRRQKVTFFGNFNWTK